jgi:hypothetical protein
MSRKHVTPPKKEPAPQFVTAEFIARKYNVSTRLVYLKAADGSIPCVKIGKKCIRFSETAVAQAWEGGAA